MLKYLVLFFFLILMTLVNADNKKNIIKNLKSTKNMSFDFEQNINGKVENGKCTIEYPKKIYCLYNKNNKLLVSNGKSLVIKTISSYYRYPLNKTPLNLILDKKFLISKIHDLNEKTIDRSYINYSILENDSKINVFFDKNSFNLIGWQIKDIYQNTALTLLHSISTNKQIEKKIFKLPQQN